MTQKEFKEANRLMWMVKGHLIPKEYSEQDIESVLHSYMTRLWHNEEAYVHEDGFEEAWEKRYGNKQNKRVEFGRSELSGSPANNRIKQNTAA